MRRPAREALLGALAVGALLAGTAAPAAAATIVVDTLADDGANGSCSLREAVQAANGDLPVDGCPAGDPGLDRVVLGAGTHTLGIGGSGDGAGDLDVSADLEIVGAGRDLTVISAAGLGDRVLETSPFTNVRIEALTLTGGRVTNFTLEPPARGGGILARGALTLVDVRVTGNAARGIDVVGFAWPGGGAIGGGIASEGPLVLAGSLVDDNEARAGHGGTFCLNVLNCAGAQGGDAIGGGIAASGDATLVASRVERNRAVGGRGGSGGLSEPGGRGGDATGGGLEVAGDARLVATTVDANEAIGGDGPGSGTPPAARAGRARGAGVRGTAALELHRGLVTANLARGGAAGSGAIGGEASGAGVAGESTTHLENVTVDGNVAEGGGAGTGGGSGGSARGAGVSALGTLTIVHATVSGQTCTATDGGAASGAGIDAAGASSVSIANTIVADSSSSPDAGASSCALPPGSSAGGNVESPGSTCGFDLAEDLDGVDAAALALAALAANGGPTETRALGGTSVALDAGRATSCGAFDQRGFPREPSCDAGAFEADAAAECSDGDGDGWGAPGSGGCAAGAATDCDDADASIHPGADEVCNGRDDDCDGVADEDLDADGDGFTTCDGDCDDGAAAVRPGATETCNGIDDDCANGADDAFPTLGDACDDGEEQCLVLGSIVCSDDGLGTACTAQADPDCIPGCTDADGDGFFAEGGDCGPADCDDTNPVVNPDQAEIPGNGLDDDCDPTTPPQTGCTPEAP